MRRLMTGDSSTGTASEANALLTYVLGEEPEADLVERWLAATTALGVSTAPLLRDIFVRFPMLIGLIDPLFDTAGPARELKLKLSIATAVAEASRQGARTFYSVIDHSYVGAIIALARLGVLEALAFPIRFLCTLVGRLWSRK